MCPPRCSNPGTESASGSSSPNPMQSSPGSALRQDCGSSGSPPAASRQPATDARLGTGQPTAPSSPLQSSADTRLDVGGPSPTRASSPADQPTARFGVEPCVYTRRAQRQSEAGTGSHPDPAANSTGSSVPSAAASSPILATDEHPILLHHAQDSKQG